ncbi:glycosyltransferase family 4 protein [Vibrio nereis]|uniref:glycosyltransferase family 4 protein n=1 Tax=Vibrio nereis TaxID=693 RepID=UPI002494E6A1|nr:glycosyltransferase family 4 protein [Vibrio nereis]
MKILYLINDITMPGGLSRVTINLVDEFAKLGGEYQVHVLSATAKFDKVLNLNIDYLDMPPLHGITPIKKLMWYTSLRQKVEKYVDNNAYDIVIAVGTAMTLFASFCRLKKAKLWGAEHSAHNGGHWFRKSIKRWRYPQLDKLICLTKTDKIRYYDDLVEDVAVIPNYTQFSDISSTYSGNKSILFVGRYNKVKGVDYLLEIISDVSPLLPEWHFNLFGEGELKSWLQAKLNEKGLSKVATVNEPTDSVSEKYRIAGILIMTSRNEGFPMVLLEAQAHGLPIVSFDCETGPSEIIHHGEDGYLIPAYDTKEFASKLVELAMDDEKRKSMSGKALIHRQKHSKEAVLELWLQQFRS